jgi:pilus assembly protein CpaC
MSAIRQFAIVLTAALLCQPIPGPAFAAEAAPNPQQTSARSAASGHWVVTVGKSLVMDSPSPVERLAVADGALADAVAITPTEVLINGKAPGETSVILWQRNGNRQVFDLSVRRPDEKLEVIRQQIVREYPGENIEVSFDNDTAFVRGTVKDVIAAERVVAIAATLGKVVNLLNVEVPPVEGQILVKVRFASVDRSASRTLAASFSSGAFNQTTAIGTGSPISADANTSFTLSEAVNIFLFRRDINVAAALKALESKNLLEMLAEPTVPAINGKAASFVAGGEFPFPMVQPGSGGAISLQWREYGVRLNFLPVITPRGTIRLQVAPEVSSLDYTHAVSVQGFTVPGISTRRVRTEIELDSGQSFVIAGLIDNQASESFSKIPGIGDIPILGKLFQSKVVTRNNAELLVVVSPEIVRPIPAGQTAPSLNMPTSFMPVNTKGPLGQPGMDATGPVPVTPPNKTIPIEQLLEFQKQGQPDAVPNQAQPQQGQAPQGTPQSGATTVLSAPAGTGGAQ